MLKSIYVACVNDEDKGKIYFDKMYEVLHQVDEHGVPVAARMGIGVNGVGTGKTKKKISVGQVRVGLHKREIKATDGTGVPVWLGQLQFDPEAGRFKQQGATPKEAGLALRQVPLGLRKVLKDFPALTDFWFSSDQGLFHSSQVAKSAFQNHHRSHIVFLQE